jgi:hypothetical protein
MKKCLKKKNQFTKKKSSSIRTVHPPILAMGKLRDLHNELLEYPPCSSDLAPSAFCVFPQLKLFLASQRFSLNQAIAGYFADLMKNHCMDGIMALEHCWNKCVSLKGDYVEKN